MSYLCLDWKRFSRLYYLLVKNSVNTSELFINRENVPKLVKVLQKIFEIFGKQKKIQTRPPKNVTISFQNTEKCGKFPKHSIWCNSGL